jgi:hypothetical protein
VVPVYLHYRILGLSEFCSTSGILAAILACVRIHQQKQERIYLSASTVTPRASRSTTRRSILLLGRDSHKSAFDAISVADCDAALLPCDTDSEFEISLGVHISAVRKALDQYGDQVSISASSLFPS